MDGEQLSITPQSTNTYEQGKYVHAHCFICQKVAKFQSCYLYTGVPVVGIGGDRGKELSERAKSVGSLMTSSSFSNKLTHSIAMYEMSVYCIYRCKN